MSSSVNADKPDRRYRLWALLVIAVLGFVMGLPTLGGGFVGGDDHRLLLNHVLVNHPSFEHAVELFTTFHRDLYQPVPLLTFQLEFAVANMFGLFERGAEGGAWLFHLTNMVLHALNAVMVWLVVATMHRRLTAVETSPAASLSEPARGTDVTVFVVATLTALLFAVHPLQVEVVAWTNGRMMLLSTLFALLGVLSFSSFLDTPRWRTAGLTLLLVLLCSLSKVRVGLPILLLVMFLARRACVERRAVALWLVSAFVVGVFALINIRATAQVDLFAEGAEYLRGPRLARVLMAISWYFQHLAWPVGLASYYPTPPIVRWSDAEVLRAIAVAIPCFTGIVFLCMRSIVARLGAVWFFSTLVATLPIMPARNILAADRYMYLPITGVLWVFVTLGYGAYRRWCPGRGGRRVFVAVGVGVIFASVGMCWHVAGFYNTPLAKTQRTVSLFPDTPRVWEPLGWTYYGDGDYEAAMACADKELRHDSTSVQSGAYQLLGMCELRRGNHASALHHLRRAIELNPENPSCYYRLGMGLDEMGRLDEAIPLYEKAVELAPSHNIRRSRLAAAYRRVHRVEDARAVHEGSLESNPYDVTAAMGLAELDIAEGTSDSFQAARQRLEVLLDWMPENVKAMTNLGAVYVTLQATEAAESVYIEALSRDPNNVTVAINLGQLYYAAGDRDRAERLFLAAAKIGPTSLAEAIVVYDFFEPAGTFDPAIGLWEGFTARFPEVIDAQAFLVWTWAQAGQVERARTQLDAMEAGGQRHPLLLAASALMQLEDRAFDSALRHVEALRELGPDGSDARGRLLGALERFDQRQPSVPWTFCLTARLLLADGRFEPAAIFTGLCEERCDSDDACRAEVQHLRERIQAGP